MSAGGDSDHIRARWPDALPLRRASQLYAHGAGHPEATGPAAQSKRYPPKMSAAGRRHWRRPRLAVRANIQLIGLWACLLSGSEGAAAQKQNEAYQLHGHRATSPIVIDGSAQEPAWQSAEVAGNFW